MKKETRQCIIPQGMEAIQTRRQRQQALSSSTNDIMAALCSMVTREVCDCKAKIHFPAYAYRGAENAGEELLHNDRGRHRRAEENKSAQGSKQFGKSASLPPPRRRYTLPLRVLAVQCATLRNCYGTLRKRYGKYRFCPSFTKMLITKMWAWFKWAYRNRK